MGRKIKVEDEDPILKKNPKLQKRKKRRAEQRKIEQEEKEKQKKIVTEYNQVRQQIIKEQQQSLKKLVKQEQKTNNFLSTIGVKAQVVKSKVLSNKKKLPLLNLNTMQIQNDKQLYQNHFKQVEESLLQKVQKKAKLSTNDVVRNELRQLFGKQTIEHPKMQEEQNEQYKLNSNLKMQTKEYNIEEQDYIVSDLVLKNLSLIPKKDKIHQSFISSYKDVIYIENQEEQTIDDFRRSLVIHALRHLHESTSIPNSNGFTNCKVLILTPFVGDANVFIDIIKSILEFKEINVEKLEELDDDSDFFRISLKINFKKKTTKYFTKFDKADIIIASPLGLRTITGVEGDEERDFSFLSSIEVLYIDRAQVIMMQNWLHLVEILKCTNKTPKYESLVNDIQTVRKSFIEEKGKFYRQNIVFSEYMFPQINTLLKKYFQNWQGYVHKINYYPETLFSSKFQQQFFRIPDSTFDQDLDVRLDYFKRKIWPRINGNELQTKFLIFTSNPFEFVKVKSYLQKVNADADFISQHTPKNKTQSRMARFNNGQYRILLLSERAYYFEICQIEKIENILFYSVPRNKWIYENLINSLVNPKTKQIGASMLNTVIGMFSRYEGHALQRIIGTTRAVDLMAKDVRCDTYIF